MRILVITFQKVVFALFREQGLLFQYENKNTYRLFVHATSTQMLVFSPSRSETHGTSVPRGYGLQGQQGEQGQPAQQELGAVEGSPFLSLVYF